MDMETKILQTLEYRVTIASAHTFLVRTLKGGHHVVHSEVGRLSHFLLDCTLLSYNLLEYLPSQIAAATVFIARRAVGVHHQAWSPMLSKLTSYTEAQVLPVARAILREKARINLNSANAVFKKHRKFGVAETVLPVDL